jgi:hypothetical protein
MSAFPWGRVTRREPVIHIVGSGESLGGKDLNRLVGTGYIIAINNAFRYVQADAVHTQDVGAIEDGRIDWSGFEGEKYIASPTNTHPRKLNNCRTLEPDPTATYLVRKHAHGMSKDPTTLHSGLNSGYSALNLALLMKPKIVYLHGIDLQGKRFHSEGGAQFCMDKTLPFFGEVQDNRVVNCSPNSKLVNFRRGSFEESRIRVAAVRQGTVYGQEYVDALRQQVYEHTGFEMVVLTDQKPQTHPNHLTYLPLRKDLKGWWAKMELFAPWNKKYRPFFYFDLDVMLPNATGALAHIAQLPDKLQILQEFRQLGRFNSSAMYIPRDVDHIWEAFTGCKNLPRGDQDFLNRFDAYFLPDSLNIKSYKFDRQDKNPTGDVVVFHGRPKMDEAAPWARKMWKEYCG